MAPVPLVFEAFKAPLKRKRGGSKPFETEMRERMARVEFLTWLLMLAVFGKMLPGLPGVN